MVGYEQVINEIKAGYEKVFGVFDVHENKIVNQSAVGYVIFVIHSFDLIIPQWNGGKYIFQFNNYAEGTKQLGLLLALWY